MTYKTYSSYPSCMTNNLIAPHGGYKNLKSFQNAEIVFDLTVEFCNSFLSDRTNKSYRSYRTYDQMVQAARSGSRNIAEGSQTSGTSKQSELRLLDVARASLEELLGDFEAFLRQNNLARWGKNDSRSLAVRQLAYRSDRTYTTYKSYMTDAESAANCLICLINQTNYLLDQQLKSLGQDLVKRGDLKDRWRRAINLEIIGESPINEDYEKFLKQQGFKRLKNGRVVSINDPADQ